MELELNVTEQTRLDVCSSIKSCVDSMWDAFPILFTSSDKNDFCKQIFSKAKDNVPSSLFVVVFTPEKSESCYIHLTDDTQLAERARKKKSLLCTLKLV